MENTNAVNADLHCHSNVSDGMLEPAELAQRAVDGGVTLWALTDHDELGGQHAARAACAALGLRYVAGVEISVTWASRTIHVVGLNVDETCAILVDGLAATRNGRVARAADMGRQLEAAGIHGAYEGALRHASNPGMVGRTHFARFLVESGVAESTSDVFSRFLVEGRPGYVEHRWASLGDAVDWIHAAGGAAVLAHPGRYAYSPLEFHALFDEFQQRGGEAIEVVTGSHTPDQYVQYAKVARRYGFAASRGSDFHAPGEGRMGLGKLPPLPADLTPVWAGWL